MKLTIQEVASGLDLPTRTVRRWVRQGRIPIRKSGGEYLVDRPVLEKWARNNDLPFDPPRPPKDPIPDTQPDGLLDAMRRGGIHYDLAGEDAETALASAVARVPELTEAERRALFDRLLQRERMTSTGIGKGVAIPHPRTPQESGVETSMIVTGFLREPVPYGAMDGKPVFLLFLLLSPGPRRHLHLLSRLSFCLRDDDFLEVLRSVPGPDRLEAHVAEVERGLELKTGA
ncbi:MAG: PTS sugar transporter subunit IIA [Desulfococcaceae bacterium]